MDTTGDYAGVTLRVAVVDFRSMLLRQFVVDDLGRVAAPIGRPGRLH